MESNKSSKHPLFDRVMALDWNVIGYQDIGEDTIRYLEEFYFESTQKNRPSDQKT